MSAILCILGFIVLGAMVNNSYLQFYDQKICLLLGNPKTWSFHSSACAFTIAIGLMIAAGGVGLFAMDFVTWKRSDRFKGKRASIAAMLIAPTMSFFAFSTAIVIGVGIKDFCNNYEANGVPRPDSCHANLKNISGLETGVGAATVAGFISGFYGVSEYLQYRRRHVNGDKW
ncbi:hypothetical protein BGZ80_010835 [Entomortierella chlamydospora]|uniref:Uncharacterized protein n=1 Tax=Entomortierella chlamydospora TaxID=101097 RepID=A0A9P6N509_9FUNG|nr:hypothetical protein BGZ80_010835 [Entomortierella chlamydospora]